MYYKINKIKHSALFYYDVSNCVKYVDLHTRKFGTYKYVRGRNTASSYGYHNVHHVMHILLLERKDH
jgi:hypothetical protein